MAGIAIENGQTPEKFIDSIDQDDPEYKRQLLRPPEIKEDMSLVTERRRVSLVLNSESFRKELEEIVETFTRSNDSTGLNSSLLSLQHLTDLLSTVPGKRPMTGGGFTKSSQNGIIPINDLRGAEASIYSRRERSLRCKLASVYRLIEMFGWNTNIYNHATVRLSRNDEHFLINPFGLLNHEITASSLIKIDIQGAILDPGSTVLGMHQDGWLLHSAVHSARPDIRCVIHLGTPATIAVSCMKTGLLPVSQEAIILGEVAYYNVSTNNMITSSDLEQINVTDIGAERAAVSQVIGQNTHILFVRCRGLLALGETVEEAWHYATNAVLACEIQLRLASLGADHLVFPTQNVQKQAYDAWRTTEAGGVSGPDATLALRLAHARSLSLSRAKQGISGDGYFSDSSILDGGGHNGMLARPWRLGELEFEALMRHLDNGGFRTGHLYRQETVSSPQRARRTLDRSGACSSGTRRYDDVEVPPYASSAAATMAEYYNEGGAFSGDESEAPRPGTLRRDWSEQKWMNTPNNYTKEVSTLPGRQSVAHWVSSREATLHSEISGGRLPPPTPFRPLTPAAIPQGTIGAQSTTPSCALTSYNRFAPQGSDPKEFKDQQKKVKDKYYHDTNTAGPQSRLLDGLSWDEARRIRDDALTKALGPGAVAAAMNASANTSIAAASKAILHRDIRDTAIVYDGVYVKHNPFGHVTDEELEAYKRDIEIKNNPTLYAEYLRQQELAATAANKQVHISATDGEHSQPAGPPICSSSAIITDSELHEPSSLQVIEAASHLSPPNATAGTSASDLDESQTTEKKQKKKRRFKLPSFVRKTRTKEKKTKSFEEGEQH